MRTIDRIFGWLMLVSALLHCIGTIAAHLPQSETLWSMGSGLAELLLGYINVMRANRPGDCQLAWASVVGCVGWLVLIVGFARLIHSFTDFRVLIQAVVTLVLLAFSVRSAMVKPTATC